MGEQQGATQATTQGTQSADPPAIRDGMTAAEVHELLRRESDRLDQKYKSAREQLLKDATSDARKQIEEEQKRAQMGELERAQAELQAIQAERDAIQQELESSRRQAEIAGWIALNAGDLDRAWRSYLAQAIAGAPETETPEQTLARVREERDGEKGAKSKAPLGVAGRPGQQAVATPNQNMNEWIREQAGRRV